MIRMRSYTAAAAGLCAPWQDPGWLDVMIGWMYHTAHLLPPHEEWRGGTACLLSRMVTTSDDSQPQMALHHIVGGIEHRMGMIASINM